MSGEPWLDRLARRVTRREALRAGALTAAAATLPVSLWRAAPAAALTLPDNSACLTGCNWFARQTAGNSLDRCQSQYDANLDRLRIVATPTLGTSGVLAIAPVLTVKRYLQNQQKACDDQAILQGKADYWNCISKPDCNGFNPMQRGGPCATCSSTDGSCCSDPLVAMGYSCCSLGCACGTDTGACHGSVTPC